MNLRPLQKSRTERFFNTLNFDSAYLFFQKKHLMFWVVLPFLYLASFLYQLIIAFLKFAYRRNLLPSYRPAVKVISVGNITLGGTGKTPLVIWITQFLKQRGLKPGIIIRGYRRPPQGNNSTGSTYFQLGDEAGMLKAMMPDIAISVGRDKIKSARLLEKEKCNALIIDDGFQHWRLERDIDIVTIDGTYLLSRQKLLPVGRLRENLGGLQRADVFVITKTDLFPENLALIKNELAAINPRALVASTVYRPVSFIDIRTGNRLVIGAQELKKPVLIVVGIANPLYFDKLISQVGIKIEREIAYPDHYHYTEADVRSLKNLASSLNIDTIITTQKDAVRLQHLAESLKPLRIYSLEIQVVFTEHREEFCQRLLSSRA